MVADREIQEPERLPRRRLKRSEYDALVDIGAFEGERVELLFGEIIEMSPQKPLHRLVVKQLAKYLTIALDGIAEVQSHSPIIGAEDSEPEPDITVYASEDDASEQLPTHIHLVVEVAHTSRSRDLGVKRRLYALTGIPEYWVIDVLKREVHVMRDPSEIGFRLTKTYSIGAGVSLNLLVFPDVVVPVDTLFEGL